MSVVIACRNEAPFIAACLDSVISNDYSKFHLEVLVVDGMSTDGTRELVCSYTGKAPFVRLVDNPQKRTPHAFNIGVSEAKGELILIMGAHSLYPPNYISQCVAFSQQYGADNVGGIIRAVPRNGGPIATAISAAVSHRFGVGNSKFRTASGEPMWADTVFGGCYRSDVFARFGLFNESLAHSQDMEFNLRLKRGGGRTLLVPSIVSYYSSRSELGSFCRHNFRNGLWAILPFAYSDIIPVGLRHLVPLVFVFTWALTALLALTGNPFRTILLILMVVYASCSLLAAAESAWQNKRLQLLFWMPLIFAALHFGYGLGSLYGVLKLFGSGRFWNKLLRRTDRSSGAAL